jgi:hypothetical protein
LVLLKDKVFKKRNNEKFEALSGQVSDFGRNISKSIKNVGIMCTNKEFLIQIKVASLFKLLVLNQHFFIIPNQFQNVKQSVVFIIHIGNNEAVGLFGMKLNQFVS